MKIKTKKRYYQLGVETFSSECVAREHFKREKKMSPESHIVLQYVYEETDFLGK